MACNKEPAIKEGVESVMGGKVIYDEIDKIFDEGVKSGEQKTVINMIKNLMSNLNISASEAMKNLGIPEDEQQEYIDKL